MVKMKWVGSAGSALLLAALSVPSVHAQNNDSFREHHGIRHVLLISVDGMHAVDYLNCSKGIAGANGGEPYCPNLAELGENGVNYLETSTSNPPIHFRG
jgi:hypothetical protein